VPTLDIARIRRDFPVLQRVVHRKRLVYLDNAATGRKPAARCARRSSNYNTHEEVDMLADALAGIAERQISNRAFSGASIA
jgi:cysteine desulfurase/selenocysteine lyase